jgi:DNA-binding beta-propeller fold protein YncE
MMFLFLILMNSLHEINALSSFATATSLTPQSSLKSIKCSSHLRNNQRTFIPTKTLPTISPSTCPSGLEDGDYIFRSSSKQSWSFCGVSGAGYHELYFHINGCECFAGVYGRICASNKNINSFHTTLTSVTPSPSVEPLVSLSTSTDTITPSLPFLVASFTKHSGPSAAADTNVGAGGADAVVTPNLSMDNELICDEVYTPTDTDTCLLVTLSDQFGDGWTSGDGRTENAQFEYNLKVASIDGKYEYISPPRTYQLNCTCGMLMGCIHPPSGFGKNQIFTFSVNSLPTNEIPEFHWEIMWQVQIIQEGVSFGDYHGGFDTELVLNYDSELKKFTYDSSSCNVWDLSECSAIPRSPSLALVSDLAVDGYSITDADKKNLYSFENPFCSHFPSPSIITQTLSPPNVPIAQSRSKLSGQENRFTYHSKDSFSFPPALATSRHLAELEYFGSVSTLAGVTGPGGLVNGIGSNSRFRYPAGVSISPDGVYALVGDYGNHMIRQIIISTASVTTLAGVAGSSGSTNGAGTNSQFNNPQVVSISPDGLYALVADYSNDLIRQIIISTGYVTTLAGVTGSAGSTNGIGTIARFDHPVGVSISPDGVYALVADYSNDMIRQINLSTGNVTTLAGTGSSGSTNGIGTNSQFSGPRGISISPDGVYALVADTSNNLVRQIIISTASVTTLAGVIGSVGSTNGIGTNSQFSAPSGVSISPYGVFALVADYSNYLIRQIIISTASVTTLAGVALSSSSVNGIGTLARFNNPRGVSISPHGVYALVADTSNQMIRQIIIFTASDVPSPVPSAPPSLDPTSAPSLVPSAPPSLDPASAPSPVPSAPPSLVPSAPPSPVLFASQSLSPTNHPSIPLFSFGVKIGNEGILNSGKAILVDYLQDMRRGVPLCFLPPLFDLRSREDDAHFSDCRFLSRLLSFRSSVVIGFHSHQVASRDSSRDRILGQRRQPHNRHPWRRVCVLARESLE